MNFESSSEVRELQAGIARLLADQYTVEKRRAIAAGPEGFSRDVWAQLVEMGVPALVAGTDHGGFGFAASEMLPVLEELGRALVLEPVVAGLIGAAALQGAASAEMLSGVMHKVAAGRSLVTLAHAEPGARHDVHWVRTRAANTEGRWLLTGQKCDVVHAQSADHWIITAVIDATTPALLLVPRDAPGTSLRTYRLVDDTSASQLRLEGTPGILLAQGEPAARAIALARDTAIAVLCGEAVGVARGALALTVQYLNVRQQFGRPLAANQALRHRVAEMAVAVETIRSAAMAALDALASGHRADIARAKMLVGRHGVKLVEDAVQLHGGIGMTQEYGVGNYLRRMTVIDLMFGDAAHHAAVHGETLLAGQLATPK